MTQKTPTPPIHSQKRRQNDPTEPAMGVGHRIRRIFRICRICRIFRNLQILSEFSDSFRAFQCSPACCCWRRQNYCCIFSFGVKNAVFQNQQPTSGSRQVVWPFQQGFFSSTDRTVHGRCGVHSAVRLRYSTVQHSTVQCDYVTVPFNTVQCSAVQHSSIQYNTVHSTA